MNMPPGPKLFVPSIFNYEMTFFITMNSFASSKKTNNILCKQFLFLKQLIYGVSTFHYLVNKNINPNQLTYVGYGNSKIIYKKALTETQSKANRRVEAIVTSIE